MQNQSISSSLVTLSIQRKLVICLLFSTIIVIGVIANSLVCYIIVKYMKKSVTSLFLLNLSLADLMMAVICAPPTLVSDAILLYWPFGLFLCKTIPFIQGLSVFLSAFTHLVISFDRFIIVFYPLRPRIKRRKAMLIIIMTWLISASIILPLPIVNYLVEKDGRYFCEEKWPQYLSNFVYSMVVLVLQYFLPILVIGGTYIAIAIRLWTQKTPGIRISQRDERIAASKKKLVRLAVLVASFYVLSQLPRHVVFLIGIQDESLFDDPNIIYLYIFCHFSSMSAQAFNPIVYFWINNNFQQNLRTLFWPCLSVTNKVRVQSKRKTGHISCTEMEMDRCLISNEIKLSTPTFLSTNL